MKGNLTVNTLTLKAAVLGLLLVVSGQTMAISEQARAQGIPSLAPMLEEVTPAVVSIRVARAMPTDSPFSRGQQFPEELRRLIPNLPEGPQQPYARGAGSGVIIDAGNGHIVTNHHVVGGANDITVQLSDGRILEAEIIGSDPNTDIALIKVEPENLAEISFADIDTVQVGDYVVAIGNPFGIGQTVTQGIVSALSRAGLNNENYEDFIQTDAAINMGNSGGALVDLEGNLVGINTAIISGSGGSNGVGFAVPVDMVAAVVEHLERDGEVRRGMLGVTIADVTPAVAEAMAMDISDGALVTSILPGSAAEAAGLEISDVIVSVDGEAIANSRALRNAVGLMGRGEEVDLRLYRGGEPMTVRAVIGGPSGQAAADSDRPALSSSFRGASLRNLTADDSEFADAGVLVLDVAQGSPAAAGGLRPGDVVIAVNRRGVADLGEFNAAIGAAERLTALTILRDGRQQLLFIP